MYNFSIFAYVSKNNLFDVIHFDDIIFIMNNVRFSKTYIESIENLIFFIFTLCYEFLAIKIQNYYHFLLSVLKLMCHHLTPFGCLATNHVFN